MRRAPGARAGGVGAASRGPVRVGCLLRVRVRRWRTSSAPVGRRRWRLPRRWRSRTGTCGWSPCSGARAGAAESGAAHFRGRARQRAHAEAGVGRSGAGRRHRQRADETRHGPRRLTRLERRGSARRCTAPADERDQTFWGVVRITARDRSTVEHELALRPGCSAQARMPPTARPAPRGERRGPLVLTAGPVPYFYGRYPAGPVDASPSDWTRTVLSLFSCARTQQSDGKA